MRDDDGTPALTGATRGLPRVDNESGDADTSPKREIGDARVTARLIGECAFLLFAVAMLLTPLVGGAFDRFASQSDNRALASAPAFPRSYDALIRWPRQADAYIADHFGLRAQLVRVVGYIHWTLLDSSPASKIVSGRNGRIFLTDDTVPYRDLLGVCGAWWTDKQVARFSRDADKAVRSLRQRAPEMPILIVPTAALLYPVDLPDWMEHLCSGQMPLATDILRRLPEDSRARIYYPIDVAAALPVSMPLIPKLNFHWDGGGVRLFVEQFAERDLGMRRQVTPPLHVDTVAADLSIFVPGVELSNRLLEPDWTPIGMAYCPRPECLNDAPLNGMALPRETARWRRPGEGGKLLLLGDSFGSAAAGTLIEYFADIVFINLNNFQLLSEAERHALWDRVTEEWRPDRIMMVIQDGNVTSLKRLSGM